MKQRVLSILVDNTAGVLSRVAGLFSRRGYNIDSITAGVTADPKFTRMTVVASGDELIQLSKLVDVLDIKVLEPEKSVNRELLLVKVAATVEERQNVISIANVFRANIVDIGQKSLVIELTGTRNKLEAFISLLEGYEILELARTGLTGLSRGADDVRFLK